MFVLWFFLNLDFQDKQIFSMWKIDTIQSSTAKNQLVLCMSNVNLLNIVMTLDHDSDDWLMWNIIGAASNLLATITWTFYKPLLSKKKLVFFFFYLCGGSQTYREALLSIIFSSETQTFDLYAVVKKGVSLSIDRLLLFYSYFSEYFLKTFYSSCICFHSVTFCWKYFGWL